MPKIIQLGQHVADLIAAGEVVSRPASVVKELVENSIDAGAGAITVEIASGGMSYIRVTDNGCGIAPEDVKVAFSRHATSKLRDASGLEAIDTLGFRGEALAAIAAVSRIELLTRIPDSDEGTQLRLEAGNPSDPSPAGSPAGTTIIVRDLFFNTPARLKFMKTDRAEGAAVSSVMLRCALSRPDISFRYIKDGRTEFHTPGDSKTDSCIYCLLGREMQAGFVPASLSDNDISVKGFISSPGCARGNRNYQFFFVNGRTIRSVLLQSALEQAYKNTLISNRFPACVLYITTRANDVDVNVHPAKTEVRFISDKQVFDSVYYAALGALEMLHQGFTGTAAITGLPLPGYLSHASARTEKAGYSSSAGERTPPSQERSIGKSYGSIRAGDGAGFVGERNLLPQLPDSAISTAVQPHFIVIGQVLSTYIITECMDSVWFIDKHAAHERIHYDTLTSGSYVPMSETLFSPIICRIGCREAQIVLDNADFMDKLGFSVESFGEDSVAVRHIPADIRQRDVEPVLSELCRQFMLGGTVEPANLDNIYKIIACKAAIKAGSSSDIRELETLAERVMSGGITHCPHGRPVAFEIPKSELEKRFGRIR